MYTMKKDFSVNEKLGTAGSVGFLTFTALLLWSGDVGMSFAAGIFMAVVIGGIILFLEVKH